MLIGGPINRSINGKGFRKVLDEKIKLELVWDAAMSMEIHDIRVIWNRAKQGTVTITVDDPAISGTFQLADNEWPFKRIQGDANLMAGKLTFEEQ